MKPYHAGLILLGIVLIWALSQREAHLSEREKALDQQTHQALGSYKALHVSIEGARRRSEEAGRALGLLQSRRVLEASKASEARLAGERGDSLLSVATSVRDSVNVLLARDSIRGAEIQALRGSLALADSALHVSEVDRTQLAMTLQRAGQVADSLALALTAEHAARTCRIAFFKCPSRLASASAGLVLGTLGTILLTR